MKDKSLFELLGINTNSCFPDDFYRVGMCYAQGKNVSQDWNKAILCFKRINLDAWRTTQEIKDFVISAIWADQGVAEAQYYLGFCYENGMGIKKDLEIAIQWYEKAAKQGFVEAMYRLGVIYFSNSYNYHDDVIGINKKKAKRNFYDHSRQEKDVKGNREKAFKLFERASKQGHIEAQYRVGMCYAEGKGVKKDWGKALDCLKKIEDKIASLNIHRNRKTFVEKVILAEKGDSEAQYFVGKCYAEGNGIGRNLRKSIEWYNKAAKHGSAEARYQVGRCYLEGKGVKENWEKAIECFTTIQDKLACLKVSEDCKEFVKYAIFAEKGSANCQFLLGLCYFRGKGVRKDWDKAINWILRSAGQNYPQAQYYLGLCYKQGKGVKMDMEKGFDCFENAAKQGLAQAQYELGMCYKRGDGVVVNNHLSKEWLKKAADKGYEKALIESGIYKHSYSGGNCASPDYDYNINF